MTMRTRFTSIGILAILMIASFLPVVPLATATNDPNNHNGGQFNEGAEWDVTDTESYTNNAIIRMDDHNVTVKKTGNLVLDKAQLLFNGHSNGQIGILVEDGGQLTIKNSAMLSMWTTKTFYCIFMKGSIVSITLSTVYGATGGKQSVSVPKTSGIWVETKDLTIDHSYISGTIWSDVFEINNTGNPTIRNSTIDVQDNYGLYMTNGANATISDSMINRPPGFGIYGIYMTGNSRAKVIKTTIQFFDQGTFGTGINVWDSYLDAIGNTFAGNYEGMTFSGKVKADLIGNDISGGQYGIRLWSDAYVKMIGDNNIHDTGTYAIEANDFTNLNATGLILKHNLGGGIHLIQATANIGKATFDSFNGQFNNDLFAEYSSVINITGGAFSTSVGSSMFKFTSGSIGTIDSASFTGNIYIGVWAERGASVKVINSKFDGTSTSLYETNGGTIESTSNKFSNVQIALFSIGGGLITSRQDNINKASAVIAYAVNMAIIDIYSMTGDAVVPTTIWTYTVDGAKIYVHDSSMLNTNVQAEVWNGYIRAINTTMKPIGVQVPQNAISGTVELGWYADLKTTWRNGNPAPGATVDFATASGAVVQTLTTDDQGMASTEAIETVVNKTGIFNMNTYSLEASLNGTVGQKSVDFKNNMQGQNAVTIVLQDNSKPELNITYPKEGDSLNTTDLTVNGTYSDTGSGIGGVILQAVPGIAVGAGRTSYSGFIFACMKIPEGTYRIFVNVTDISGNVASAQVNVTIDRTIPTIRITKPVGLYSQNKTFYLNGTTDIGTNVTVNGTKVTNVNGAFGSQLTLLDGDHNIIVTSTDAAGNKAIVTKEVIVDTIPPVVTTDLKDQSAVMFPGLRLQGTLTDASGTLQGGLLTCKVNGKNATVDQKNGTWKIDLTLTEGQNDITISATDPAGNSATLHRTLFLDTVPPVITMISPAGTGTFYTNKTNVVIKGKATDLNLQSVTVNGVATTFDANGTFTASIVLSAGPHTVTINASDRAGNIARFNVAMVVDILISKAKITSPADGSVTKSSQVTVIGIIDDPSAMLKLGNSNVTNNNGTFTGTATLVLGLNTITVTATDLAGNVGTTSIKVTYDNDAKLTLTKPTKTSVSTTTKSVTISGTSETGAKVYVNDVMIPTNADGSFSYNLIVKEGKTTVTVKAVDLAGNEKTSPFTVNYTNPKQFDLGTLLGLGIVLMIVGVLVGLVVGRMMAKPKAKPPMEEDEAGPEPEVTKPAPKVEEPEEEKAPFTPEEDEEEPEEKPAPKAPLKDKQGDTEAPSSVTEPKTAPPKPEPKPEPKPAPKDKPKAKTEDSLESLLNDLEKKKK